MVKVPPLSAPQLGACASSGRAWRRWAARHSQEETGPLSAQPLPRVLELTASKAADVTTFDHAGSVLITAILSVPASSSVSALQSSLTSSLGTAASASAALGITVVSDPTFVSGGECQGWHVVLSGDLSSPYTATDCQQLCTLSASCGAVTFKSQDSYTYCYMHFQQVTDCKAAESFYQAPPRLPYSCDAHSPSPSP